MGTKFTPGPWRIGNAGTAVFQPKSGDFPKVVADLARTDNYRENARLVCAAPDLYAACENAAERAAERGDKAQLSMLNAALAKARGEQP